MPLESAYFIIEEVDDKHDLKDVKRGLDQLHGVTSVSVDLDSHLVAIDYDSSGTSYDGIEHRLNKMGYQIAADASDIYSR
ncbi:heavy-metal-associated domain-containing protein [Zongyangia hominis]|uniref:Heavy-metal-associated domain-containing protein n=1 Tax=Zongyangia hominis TaxID=2763677 RepID=A0A926EAG0_9FIRM|nr:heavy metal-associated domain-containing protein [Zongyangia hominis]MBC8569395.1 heavy-metal-associated domain-containing protein [Zongyangia hominis]